MELRSARRPVRGVSKEKMRCQMIGSGSGAFFETGTLLLEGGVALEVNLIGRQELKEKLDRGDHFKLVMVLGDWTYRAKHIPGSLNVTTPEAAAQVLDPEDEIVVYCSSPECAASRYAYHLLTEAGYKRVSRYAGGIADWEEAGYLLEGDWVG